ncbi:hypothetical protein ACEV9Z_13190 [Vibrio parahaemolyticus]|nr:hypothetical protein [Vibrio parahaemolyticus]
MDKYQIEGINIEVGNKIYTTRNTLIAVTLFFLFLVTNSERGGYFQLVLTLFLAIFLVIEIKRLVYKPTLLAIGYDGIYHCKVGFISWGNIERVEYYVNNRNILVKSLRVYIKTPKITQNYWFIAPIALKHNVLNLSMSYTDCNVKAASAHAKVMKAWYEACRDTAG